MAKRDTDAPPTGRVRRAARVGKAVGGQGAKLAGTRVANVARGERGAKAALERRHREAAEEMVKTLGSLRGAAQKLGQIASFVDTDLLPAEYRELYQNELGRLRSHAPPMPWRRVERVLADAWERPLAELFTGFETEAVAAASIGQVHRAELRDGRRVAVKVQYPEIADALRADLGNIRVLLRLARALAPGLDANAVAAELKERVLEELDYGLEARAQRRFASAYRGHPFIVVPRVVSGMSRERVLVSDWIDGLEFDAVKKLPRADRDRFGEIVFRFAFGSIYHLGRINADAHPGNYLLTPDGHVAFLDFGMTKRLERERIEGQIAAVTAILEDDAGALLVALRRLGFIADPTRVDADELMEHARAIGGWYLNGKPTQITARVVSRTIGAASDPRSRFYSLMRRESMPADELLGRRMETGVLAVLGQLRATADWTAIGREWWFAEPPRTPLGEAEWRYFESRGRGQTAVRPA